jgi:hypothetical protein
MQASNNVPVIVRERACRNEWLVRGPVDPCLSANHSAQTLTVASRAPDTR